MQTDKTRLLLRDQIKLLQKIRKNPFSEKRVEGLSNRKNESEDFDRLYTDGYIRFNKHHGKYFVEDKAVAAIREYQEERLDLWLRNAWIPIIVTLFTTLAAQYLMPSIWRWLLRLLQQIP